MIRKELFLLLVNLTVVYNKEMKREALVVYVQYLERYDKEVILRAIDKVLTSCKFYPSIAEIINFIEGDVTDKDKANEMAGNIIRCIREHGYTNPEEAQKEMGPIAWESVKRFGGWDMICNSPLCQLSTIRAQLRDMCLAMLKTNESKIDNNFLSFEKSDIPKLK